MADSGEQYSDTVLISFSDFPEDVQLCILSFLSPSDIFSFSCTSKYFVSLFCEESDLWYALCDRKWGSKTQIRKWGDGQVSFKLLYKILDEYENLIGFWRRIGGSGGSPDSDSISIDSSPLVFFEWGPSYVTGSRVSPSKNGGYNVVTTPFVWISLSPEGEANSYLDPNCGVESFDDTDYTEKDLVPVSVSFMGKGHVFVEECRQLDIGSGSNSSNSSNSSSPDTRRGGNGWLRSGSFLNMNAEDLNGIDFESLIGSPPDRLMCEMYQHLANKTSPRAGVDRASRRQKRRGRERRGWRRWEPEHMVKIVDCFPTPCRPLQGLWKGICDDMSLDFYLVTYDEIGGIACRRVGDSSKPFSSGLPVFWTSDATFIESPFNSKEELLYSDRLHLKPDSAFLHLRDDKVVSRVMNINSSHNMVIPDLAESTANPNLVEGRIWQYNDGTFGFGFLRNSSIVDLKHIAQDGCLLAAN
ncbi:hypothetical protein V2J09_011791 [Rumex salicifolius]